ncbi:hypothetical protein ACHAXT_009567 [Thalassiosira profunda]
MPRSKRKKNKKKGAPKEAAGPLVSDVAAAAAAAAAAVGTSDVQTLTVSPIDGVTSDVQTLTVGRRTTRSAARTLIDASSATPAAADRNSSPPAGLADDAGERSVSFANDSAEAEEDDGPSIEVMQRRRGITPAGDLIKACACKNSTCRDIMWEWASLGEEYRGMVDYGYIPGRTKKTTPLGQHVNGYHDGSLLHLLGRDSVAGDVKKDLSSQSHTLAVAMHHWKVCLRDDVRKSKATSVVIDKYRTSIDAGKEAGLTPNDLCSIKGNDGAPSYYCFPTVVDFKAIKFELNEAKKQNAITARARSAAGAKKPARTTESTTPACGGFALGSFGVGLQTPASASYVPPRRSPVEREHEQRVRDAADNPEKMVVELEEWKKKHEALQKAYEEMKEGRARDKEAFEKKEKEMKEEFERQIQSTGLSRFTLLSAEWHKKYHWMSNFLVGFEKWKYFKAAYSGTDGSCMSKTADARGDFRAR